MVRKCKATLIAPRIPLLTRIGDAKIAQGLNTVSYRDRNLGCIRFAFLDSRLRQEEQKVLGPRCIADFKKSIIIFNAARVCRSKFFLVFLRKEEEKKKLAAVGGIGHEYDAYVSLAVIYCGRSAINSRETFGIFLFARLCHQ